MIQFQPTDYIVGQWFFEFNPAITGGIRGCMTVVLMKRDIDAKPHWCLVKSVRSDAGNDGDMDGFPIDNGNVTEEKAFTDVDKMIAEMATEHGEIYDYVDVRGGVDQYAAKVRTKPYMNVKSLSHEEALAMAERGELPPEVAETIKKRNADKAMGGMEASNDAQ